MVQNPKYWRAKEYGKTRLVNVNKEKSHFSRSGFPSYHFCVFAKIAIQSIYPPFVQILWWLVRDMLFRDQFLYFEFTISKF